MRGLSKKLEGALNGLDDSEIRDIQAKKEQERIREALKGLKAKDLSEDQKNKILEKTRREIWRNFAEGIDRDPFEIVEKKYDGDWEAYLKPMAESYGFVPKGFFTGDLTEQEKLERLLGDIRILKDEATEVKITINSRPKYSFFTGKNAKKLLERLL